MKIVLTGVTPAKKNSRNLFVRNGRLINVPSDRYKLFERRALVEIQQQARGQADGPVIVTLEIYNKDRRKHDLDNQAASVLDVLVKGGLIEDDDCFHVAELHVIFGGIDKENPRCEVDIEEINR